MKCNGAVNADVPVLLFLVRRINLTSKTYPYTSIYSVQCYFSCGFGGCGVYAISALTTNVSDQRQHATLRAEPGGGMSASNCTRMQHSSDQWQQGIYVYERIPVDDTFMFDVCSTHCRSRSRYPSCNNLLLRLFEKCTLRPSFISVIFLAYFESCSTPRLDNSKYVDVAEEMYSQNTNATCVTRKNTIITGYSEILTGYSEISRPYNCVLSKLFRPLSSPLENIQFRRVCAISSFVVPTVKKSDFVTNAEIYENDIESCGLYDFVYNRGAKNGEGICE